MHAPFKIIPNLLRPDMPDTFLAEILQQRFNSRFFGFWRTIVERRILFLVSRPQVLELVATFSLSFPFPSGREDLTAFQ